MSTQKLIEGNVGAIPIRLTVPMVWGILATMSLNLIDTYFVAKLGTDELAAMSFTFPVVRMMQSVALGLGIGASSVIAVAIGVGDRHKVQQLTTNSIILSLAIVGVLTIVGLTTINPLFKILGASDRVLLLIRDYMEIWYLGIIFQVVSRVSNCALLAAGNTKVPSAIVSISAAINIVLDPLLIFGWGDFPH